MARYAVAYRSGASAYASSARAGLSIVESPRYFAPAVEGAVDVAETYYGLGYLERQALADTLAMARAVVPVLPTTLGLVARMFPWLALLLLAYDLYQWYRGRGFVAGYTTVCETGPLDVGPINFGVSQPCGAGGYALGADPGPYDAPYLIWQQSTPPPAFWPAAISRVDVQDGTAAYPQPYQQPVLPLPGPFPFVDPWQNGKVPERYPYIRPGEVPWWDPYYDPYFDPAMPPLPAPQVSPAPVPRPAFDPLADPFGDPRFNPDAAPQAEPAQQPVPDIQVFPLPAPQPQGDPVTQSPPDEAGPGWPFADPAVDPLPRARRDKEKKPKNAYKRLRLAISHTTEALDLLQCFHDAIPGAKTKVKKVRFKDKKTGKWGTRNPTDAKGRPITHPRPQVMAREVYNSLTGPARLDRQNEFTDPDRQRQMSKMLACIFTETLQDYAIGKAAQKANTGYRKMDPGRPFGPGTGPAL